MPVAQADGHQQPYVLVLYYSRYGAVRALAREIAVGIESEDITARLRRAPSLTSEEEDNTAPCTLDDLRGCAGLALGSPTRFGSMSAALQAVLETTGGLWMDKALSGKPASVFTSCSGLHSGHESTLLSMMHPLLHHGMLLVGAEYDSQLRNTTSGGTPYGVSHWAREQNASLTGEEQKLCRTQGQRLARIVRRLESI